MEAVNRRQIMPFTNLTCVKTEKFKTGCLSITLVTQLNKDSASKNALLPKVLRRGTALHPDLQSLAASLDELYGARVEPMIRKKGELHCIGFYADFIDDSFVAPGEYILEKMAALLGEILLAPRTHGGQLLTEFVDSERDNLIDEIRAGINDKRRYSVDRCIEKMCDTEDYGTNKLGTEASARSITASSLTKYYRSLIAAARIEVFYCGSADPDRVAMAVKNALEALPRNELNLSASTEVKLSPPSGDVRTVTEKLDVTQGKLVVGFRIGQAMKNLNLPALIVFNAVYGGAVTSKLFLNVREKLSLCYFASSMVEKHKGVMLVSSGVDFSKYDEALKEILHQLDEVRNGNIEDWELLSAKRAVVTSIKTSMDRPSGLEDLYFEQAVADLKCTPIELAALCEEVTAEEVSAVAKSVVTDTVYFLTGLGGT